MLTHDVRVHPSKDVLKREDQLAWKIAAVAADKVRVQRDVADMIVNRIIDNAAVAVASVNRSAPTSARGMALGHPRKGGATVFGVASDKRVSPEWAAWANGTAVRELDMHDTFLAADYSHPGRQHPADPGRGADDGQIRRRPDPRPGHRVRDPDRPGARDLPARAQDRPHRPSVPGAGRRHRHPARPEGGRDLPGGAAGGACQLHHAAVPQGRDQLVEGLRPAACRQAGDRGGGPGHAGRGRAVPGVRGRGQRDRLDAGRQGRAVQRAAARARRSRSAPSWTATPRSIRPSTRARR